VKKFEGFQAHAYGDFKQYSIGYGTRANSPYEVIDQAEAEKRLRAELQVADQSVENFAPNAPVGVKQALTSLTYNAGPIWQRQDLGALIKAGSYEEAKAHFLQYNHAGGQVNDGLTKRRQAEVQWFDHPL
jgi:lysozyme